ncbi:MAG: N-acetylmuramoyl-L-alanine amidase [Verrucomicrobia bacterium]|nr:N-acetylmuramoyl-L-alanine amidase [Verrucomicrobiota bacterium]
MRQVWGVFGVCVIAMAALICGCSTPKPRAYTRFPQTLIPPPPPSAPISAATNGATVPAPTPPGLEPVAATPPPSPATAPVVPPLPASNDNEPWTPIALWCRAKGLPTPEIQAGSRAVKIGGITHYLGFEPTDQGGAICIHPLDRIKTFEPLTLAPTWPHPRILVLDPGHGGVQAGSRCLTGNRFEKEFTLDWALRLRPLLEAQGWTVHLTRTNDCELSLAERVRVAETQQAGLFISLHFNSSFPNTQAHGLETYCLTPCGLTSTTTRAYADDTTATFPNNQHDAANVVLARRIHRHLLRATGTADRGIRRARFMDVLRGQNRPAVLVEGGFLSNAEESQRINTPAYRQRLAEGVARALE